MPLLTDWNCRNCFSSAHGGWEGTSTSVPSSCSRYWFCFLPRLPCLFREFFFPFTPSALHPFPLFLPGRSFYFHSRLLFPSATSFYLKTHALFSICDVKLAIPWLYTLTSVSIFSTLFQYISSGSEKENLSINQELFSLFIIFLILVTLMSYSGVIS